jgi:hypothetical protein
LPVILRPQRGIFRKGWWKDFQDLAGYYYGIRALRNTVSDQAAISESQDILQLTKASFVASEVGGELIILTGEAKPVVG